jgi:sulfate transport system permease protein
MPRIQFRQPTVLPGFWLSGGFTLAYLGLVVLIPILALLLNSMQMSWRDFIDLVTSARALAALKLSFGASFAAALLNTVFGLVVAWVLVRYPFPGRALVDALVDLPFALPTAVAGITLTSLYDQNGWLGSILAPMGVKAAYTPLGIIIALTFIGLPFVVRTLQPVLREIDPEVEDAAESLGARRWQTFAMVIFPSLVPALLTGFTMAFARAIGEYGSVVFISGNMPFKTEIAPLLIMIRLEEFDFAGATALAVTMLLLSFALLTVVNALQWWSSRSYRRES